MVYTPINAEFGENLTSAEVAEVARHRIRQLRPTRLAHLAGEWNSHFRAVR